MKKKNKIKEKKKKQKRIGSSRYRGRCDLLSARYRPHLRQLLFLLSYFLAE